MKKYWIEFKHNDNCSEILESETDLVIKVSIKLGIYRLDEHLTN